jgi:threonine/homoserine/homoserine lactone efflux protein
MPPPELLLPFLAAVLLVELTPGPNMGYLAIVGGQWGRRAAFLTILGVTAGLAVYMLAAVFGLAEIILRVGWLYQLLRWAGVAFLLWLAWDTWRGAATDPAAIGAARPSPGALLTRGFLANVLNPKAAVFYIGLLPGFTDPARPFAGQALTLGLIHIGVALAIHAVIVLAAARAIPLLAATTDGAGRHIRTAFALALAAIALWLAWETRG